MLSMLLNQLNGWRNGMGEWEWREGGTEEGGTDSRMEGGADSQMEGGTDSLTWDGWMVMARGRD